MDDEIYSCKYCRREFSTRRGCSRHERYCLENPNHEIKEGHVAWNKGLTKETDSRVAKVSKTRRNRIHSGEIVCIGRKHTEEEKMLISQNRKKYLLEHPDEHVWKRETKFKSEPCEFLKRKLLELGVCFVEEYNPIECSAIAVDIAFPDIKVGIEVNGNQHYNRDGSLKEYYQIRHERLESAGWKIYEIHYTLCYKVETLDEILNLDVYNKNYVGEYFSNKELREQHKIKVNKDKDEQRKLVEIEREKLILEKCENILSSEIDFSKLGWVTKVSMIIGIKPQKVSAWMRKNMPDFYTKCYHRKPIDHN